MKKIAKIYKYLLYILPLALYFSYFPVISLGGNETMNFELSLPLVWLVVFDVVAFIMICLKLRREILYKIFGSVGWWLFPIFVTFSVIWSPNPLRGILTVGVMWALIVAVLGFWELREYLDAKFWKVFWRWFFGSAIMACVWCVVQCILDVNGVPQEATLLCDGCVYQMFGFPHPNGWAIEPQFMGNLLLAPVIVSFYFKDKNKKYLWLFLLFTITLFLTFSRGAIYACGVGMVFLFFFVYFRSDKKERPGRLKQILKAVGILVVSFAFTLNLQGILAASSPTSDTYRDGVAKVLNHLSLGVIDIREDRGETGFEEDRVGAATEITGVAENQQALLSGDKVVENSVENSEITEAVFDGYVEESTDTRVRLASAALSIWRQDFTTMMFGVGIGGAGQALYDNGLSPAPKEIVQNEYASLLLETGVVGVSLLLWVIILAVRAALRNRAYAGMILALMVAYGVSFIFFSGLPNALQIILLPGLFVVIRDKYKNYEP